MKKRLHILLLWVLCVTMVSAEALSLDSCLEMAKRNNVAVKNAQLDVAYAKQVKAQALTHYFPQAQALALGYHAQNPMFELGIDDIKNAGVRGVLNTLYNNYGAALGLSNTFSLFQYGAVACVTAMQPVFAGGQIVAGNRLAKVGVEAAEVQAEIAERDMLAEVEECYWLVVELQEKRATLETAKNLLDTLHRFVETTYEAGFAMRGDLLRVEMKQNELLSQELQLKNGIALAKQALCQSIGLAYTDSTEVMDSVVVVTDGWEMEEGNGTRAESRLLDLSVRAGQLERRMTLGKSLPQVMFGGSYSYNNLFEKNSLNGTLFFTVQVPLTSWWETGHKLKAHDLQLEKTMNQRTDLLQKMELQRIQMRNSIEEARLLIEQAEKASESANENYRLARVNYEAGMLTMSDLLEAQTLCMQAQNGLTEARIQYGVRKHRYELYYQ